MGAEGTEAGALRLKSAMTKKKGEQETEWTSRGIYARKLMRRRNLWSDKGYVEWWTPVMMQILDRGKVT